MPAAPPPSAAAFEAMRQHPELQNVRYRDRIAALNNEETSRRLSHELIVAVILIASALAVALFLLYL